MTAFDKYSELDPAKFQRDVEELHGSAFFDNYAILDDAHRVAQIEEATGVEISNYAIGNPALMIAETVTAIEEGGSDAPEWVPDDAKIYIDLVNNRAWTEADGEVVIDTLLGSDANTDNAWGPTTYNADYLTADGYLPTDESETAVAFIGAARTTLVAESTVRIVSKDITGTGQLDFAVVTSDGNDGVQVNYGSGEEMYGSSYNGDLNLQIPTIINHGEGVLNCFAFTLTPTNLDVAANGSDAESAALTTDDYPEAGMNAALIDLNTGANCALQSITIYDALPTTDGLSELSETGVTNTAPSNLRVSSWYDWSPDGSEGVYLLQLFANAGEVVPVAIFVADEAQGNPLTYSLSSVDAGIEMSVNPSSNFTTHQVRVDDTEHGLVAGDYNFTVRATDPGGLYVEQEFTITVTE